MALRVGILIIGSLAWDTRRAAWRNNRLVQRESAPATAPIRYQRRSSSRGNTYTMVFSPGSPGRALLFPCSRTYQDFETLRHEAIELWKAEDANARGRCICTPKKWGAVGLLPRPAFDDHPIVTQWKSRAPHALKDVWEVRSSLRLNDGGILEIDWPPEVPDTIDLILATTNQASDPVDPNEIAQAWLNHAGCDNGWEEYFFRNVEFGIRTADDLSIWSAIEKAKPKFISDEEATARCYATAISILRREAGAADAIEGSKGQQQGFSNPGTLAASTGRRSS